MERRHDKHSLHQENLSSITPHKKELYTESKNTELYTQAILRRMYMRGIPMVKKHRHTNVGTYSSNQSLVAHTGSATGSDHRLDVPGVCKVSSNVRDEVGKITGPGVRNEVFQDCLRMHMVHSGV
eukprot:6202825-Pleurochrysis_carterae.AAC.1